MQRGVTGKDNVLTELYKTFHAHGAAPSPFPKPASRLIRVTKGGMPMAAKPGEEISKRSMRDLLGYTGKIP